MQLLCWEFYALKDMFKAQGFPLRVKGHYMACQGSLLCVVGVFPALAPLHGLQELLDAVQLAGHLEALHMHLCQVRESQASVLKAAGRHCTAVPARLQSGCRRLMLSV